jgi:hypothetical protein
LEGGAVMVLPVTVPEVAHPFVKALFAEMVKQGSSGVKVCHQAGIHYGTMKAWRGINLNPRVACIDGALRAVGFKLAVVPLHANESAR